jgi:hypothetical protein
VAFALVFVLDDRYSKIKLDPTFNGDKSELTYTRQVYWNLLRDQSVADPKEVFITTMNPPFLGALSHAGNENLLPVGYSAVVLRELFDFLQTTFWDDSQTWYAAPVLQASSSSIISTYSAQHGVSTSEATLWFLNLWANGTATTGNATLDAFAMPLVLGTEPLSIPASTASALFDSSNPDSITAAPTSWLANSIVNWKSASTNNNQRQRLATAFGLSQLQVMSISKWLQSSPVANVTIVPSLQREFGFTTTQEMACIAYGLGTWGAKSSVATLYPAAYPHGPIEFYYWNNAHFSIFLPGPTLTLDRCMKMFFTPGSPGMLDALPLGDLLKQLPLYLASNESVITAAFGKRWGITTSGQINQILNYFTPILFKDPLSVTYGAPGVAQWTRPGGGSGLFVTRSAHEWLWDYTDPLVIRMLPDAPPMSFRHNLSTPEVAHKLTRPWTVNTGVKDIKKLQNTIVWDGFRDVNFYKHPLQVEGATEDGQYPPFVRCDPSFRLGTWIDDYARDIPLACVNSDSQVHDLKTYQFTPDNTTWQVNDWLGSEVLGFSNISAKYNDSPVFLSNPHFFASPPYWPSRLTGDSGKINLARDMTMVDIEPYTGKVVQFVKGLQVNLYISQNNTWFDYTNHSTIYKDMMFPVMYGIVHTTVTPSLTKIVTGTVYVALKAKTIIFWCLLGISVAFMLASIIPAVIAWRRNKKAKSGYTLIQ